MISRSAIKENNDLCSFSLLMLPQGHRSPFHNESVKPKSCFSLFVIINETNTLSAAGIFFSVQTNIFSRPQVLRNFR